MDKENKQAAPEDTNADQATVETNVATDKPEEKPEDKATCSILRLGSSPSIQQACSIRKVLIN